MDVDSSPSAFLFRDGRTISMLELRVEKGAPVGRVAFPVDWSLEVLVRVVAVAVAVVVAVGYGIRDTVEDGAPWGGPPN